MTRLDGRCQVDNPLRIYARVVTRLVELGTTPVRDLARLGKDTAGAALLTLVSGLLPEHDAEQDLSQLPQLDDATVERLTREVVAGSGQLTRAEVAAAAGVPLEQAQRLWRAVGFAQVEDDRAIFTSSDVTALKDAAALLEDGIVDDEQLMALARPIGHMLSRLAAVQSGAIIDVLSRRLNQTGDGQMTTMNTLATQAVQVTDELLPVLERTTLYVWRRHLAVEASRQLLERSVFGQPSRTCAVGFIDLAGFTRLTRQIDGPELSRLLTEFETLVFDTVAGVGGQVVKTLGDEVLFTVDDPATAADITLMLLERSETHPVLPAAHAGLAYGPVLIRAGDVFGPVVNVAARLAGLARRGTARIDTAMAEALQQDSRFTIATRPPRPVRGYPGLRSYRLRRRPSSQ